MTSSVTYGLNAEHRPRFEWVEVDGVQLPSVTRRGRRFVPVRVVERYLLAPYASRAAGRNLFQNRSLLASHYVTLSEVVLFGVNAKQMYGQFTAQDLVVDLDEFLQFFNDVKKLCAEFEVQSISQSFVGGWVQINNSVVPYVNVDNRQKLPLCIVQNAAGLLQDIDQRLMSITHPTAAERDYLNTACAAAGLQFAFDLDTAMVDLRLVCGSSVSQLYVRFLRSDDPFADARYVEEVDGVWREQEPGDACPQPVVDVMGVPVIGLPADAAANWSTGGTPIFLQGPDASGGATLGAVLAWQEVAPSAASILQPVVFRDKTISSLRKPDGNYVLVEAFCRVFFPNHSVQRCLRVLESFMHVPIDSMTDEEERCFIDFYRLPTAKLRCRKIVKLSVLSDAFARLELLLKAFETAGTAAVAAATAQKRRSPECGGGHVIGTVSPNAPTDAVYQPSSGEQTEALAKRRRKTVDYIEID